MLYAIHFVSMTESALGTLLDYYADVGRQELGTPEDTLQAEIKTYMDDKIIEADSCILKWWRDNKTRFPKLARAAQNILGVPASQAYSERLFSRAGNIVTEKRTCLLCHRVEQLCFLSANRPKQQW